MGRSSAAPVHELARPLSDEIHGFGGEAIEGGDAEFEVIFLCIFDFVVADAAERLNKHHHGRNSGARDFGGIVKRA